MLSSTAEPSLEEHGGLQMVVARVHAKFESLEAAVEQQKKEMKEMKAGNEDPCSSLTCLACLIAMLLYISRCGGPFCQLLPHLPLLQLVKRGRSRSRGGVLVEDPGHDF